MNFLGCYPSVPIAWNSGGIFFFLIFGTLFYFFKLLSLFCLFFFTINLFNWRLIGGISNKGTLSFLGSKIIADGDCSHEIKRHLLLGRKAMTNIDSVLKSRDIILLSKVHIVKAMVFPLVMYQCESWSLKKTQQC